MRSNVCWIARVTLAVASPLLAGLAMGQVAPTGVTTPLPSLEQIITRTSDPYTGSVPQGKATNQLLDLTAEDAVDRGLKYNLGLFLSDRVTDQAKAARKHALSELLPDVNGSVSEEGQKLNLKAFGFTFPGFPTSVGPFGLMDIRATGTWNLVDLSRIDSLKASNENIKAARFSYRDARDTVVLAVGADYLLTIANESRVDAAEAELRTAEALYQLAVDQEKAGLAPNIDTLRARVQLQSQQEALIQAQNALEKQRLALARVIGLPLQQKFRLVNRVPYSPLPEADLNNIYERALQTRADYQAALASLKSAQLSREAAWKQRLPSLNASGEYGVLGYTPNGLAPNYTGAVTLKIPVFQGGKIQADIDQAEAALRIRQAQADNLKAAIEQDVQDSLLDLKAAAQAVQVATIGLDLAQQALAQSQDRFAAGVTNNVEVIQAQQQLANANDQYITSLYAHNIAKVLLARAIGNAEQAVKQYLSQPGSTVPVTPPTPATPNPNPSSALGGSGFGNSTATVAVLPTSNVRQPSRIPSATALPSAGASQQPVSPIPQH